MLIENMTQYLVQHLIVNYNVSPTIALRYAKVLANRAIRFYINSNLDESVLAEDLYQEEEGSNIFPNLDYSEQQDKEWIKKEVATLKEIANDNN